MSIGFAKAAEENVLILVPFPTAQTAKVFYENDKKTQGFRVLYVFIRRTRCSFEFSSCDLLSSPLALAFILIFLNLVVMSAVARCSNQFRGVMEFSSRARIWGECSTIHSPPELL